MATTKSGKTATTTRKRTTTAAKARSKDKAPATSPRPEVNAALAAAKQAAVGAAAASAIAAETPQNEAGPQEAQEALGTDRTLRKRGLISEVAARSGVKRGDAKAAVESALAVLGEAIADGRGLNLPGLGKLKVVRTKKQAKAHVFVTKLRQPFAAPEGDGDDAPKDPLAEAAE